VLSRQRGTVYDELVSVCRTQTKPRSDVGGCDEMVGEVPRCLTVKTAVHHDIQLAHPNALFRLYC